MPGGLFTHFELDVNVQEKYTDRGENLHAGELLEEETYTSITHFRFDAEWVITGASATRTHIGTKRGGEIYTFCV